MPLISRRELRQWAETTGKGSLLQRSVAEASLRKAAAEAKDTDGFDIFLSHRYSDAHDAAILAERLRSFEYVVYVNWQVDPNPAGATVTREIADVIRKRMGQCSCLLYAESSAAGESKWMPWELGYSDGRLRKAAVIPLVDEPTASEENPYAGREYLNLYPYVTSAPGGINGPGDLVIRESPSLNRPLRDWLRGSALLRLLKSARRPEA